MLIALTVNNQRSSGILIFIGIFIFSMALLIGEALRPAYSLNMYSISSLGIGTHGEIFYYSILLMGALIVIAGIILLSGEKKEAWHFTLILVGIGSFGVGIFPYIVNYPPLHSDFAFFAFIFGGITALLFATHKGTPFRIFSPIVGIIVLASIFLYASGKLYGLGPGGMERMIVYPTLFWALALSGHLMNQKE
ncbi:MAG TPA: DUF998 domain-containing protein [Thermoplasmataceae archaeon]|nr:DUF998 domain-containing protein [Thermoplasmataceae archaeon]